MDDEVWVCLDGQGTPRRNPNMPTAIVRKGPKYSVEYLALFPDNCLVFSDQEQVLNDQTYVPLIYDLPGWWSKMELFSPEVKQYRPFMYVDIDSYIIEDPCFEPTNEFYMCEEWMPGAKPGKAQSSVMIIPKEVDHIWEHFKKNKDQVIAQYRSGGDQDYLATFKWKSIQKRYPGAVGSYRLHNIENPTNEIVTFHGQPKPPNSTGWAREVWEDRTGYFGE